MADKGFKIRTELAAISARLYIPPMARGVQMTDVEVKETQNIANLRIYVEQAIGRMKTYRILSSGDVALLYLPILDDILLTIAALNNLADPLCKR